MFLFKFNIDINFVIAIRKPSLYLLTENELGTDILLEAYN